MKDGRQRYVCATGIQRAETRDAAKLPTVHRTAPHNRGYLAPNGNSSCFTHKAQFRLATFQVLNSHMELVATILDTAAL